MALLLWWMSVVVTLALSIQERSSIIIIGNNVDFNVDFNTKTLIAVRLFPTTLPARDRLWDNVLQLKEEPTTVTLDVEQMCAFR